MITFDKKIPNKIFFCYFGGKPFKLINYLAVKSAYEVNKPESLDIYLDVLPKGEWWDLSKQYLNIINYKPSNKIFGIDVPHPAHQADIARLEILIEKGGIYLDLDVICNRAFKYLLDKVLDYSRESLVESTVILGEEVIYEKKVGFCTAVIFAKRQSIFLKRWLEGFDPNRSLWKGFRSKGDDSYYSELSTKYTKFLQFLYPEEITNIDKKYLFYPNYSKEELEKFFTTNTTEFDEAYSYHLWSNATWYDYLKDMTIKKIKETNTVFTKIAKRFLD